MRVLIIGGTGFIGPHIVHMLHNAEHEIRVFHRGKSNIELPPGVMEIQGDRNRLPDYEKQFREFASDVVLDMVPITEKHARDVMRVFAGLTRRIVAISSQDVYRAYGKLIGIEQGQPDPVPFNEESPLRNRLYPYRGETPREENDPHRIMDDYDKILIEHAVMNDPELPGTVLRLPMVYGPGDRQHRLFEYIKRMDDQRPAIILAEKLANWRWTRGYVENVANAVVLAIINDNAAGRIYNVGETEAFTMQTWVKKIAHSTGWKGKVIVVPDDKIPDQMKIPMKTEHHLVTDSTRIRNELDYRETVEPEEALKRTIEWERAHPPEQINRAQFDYAAENAVLKKI